MKLAMPGLLKAQSAQGEPSGKYYKMGVQQSSTRKSFNFHFFFNKALPKSFLHKSKAH
jgi:hypothetical protein